VLNSSNNRFPTIFKESTVEEIKDNNDDDDSLVNINPLDNFLFVLKAEDTKKQYPKRLKIFFDFGLDPSLTLEQQAQIFYNKSQKNINWTYNYFRKFIEYQKIRVERNEIVASTIPNYYKAAKLFCEMNDMTLNWKKITKGMPSRKSNADDRAPSLEEIKKLMAYPDLRIKPIVLTMLSSGIRSGAWDHLKWKHVTPLYNEKEELIAAKILVYPGDKEEYYSFITSEAYLSLKDWIEYRQSFGEKITGESWVMRDIWQTSERSYGAYFGLAANPKKLKSSGIKSMMERAYRSQGLWKPLENTRRHEFKIMHGFRKWFKTKCENAGMKSINIEILMGHNIGVSGSYYKPTEQEILIDYLKIIDQLIINDEFRLSQQVQELKEKNENKDYIIKGKLQEKEQEINDLKRSTEFLTNRFNAFLISQSENKILINGNGQSGIVKGIQLKPEINNKAVAEIAIPSTSSSNNKKSKLPKKT
jgi:hypothetical protein